MDLELLDNLEKRRYKMREVVYLAGLLHDIGKFYQRADVNGAASSTILNPQIKNLENQLCPIRPGTTHYSHKHVLWTAQFFSDFEAHFRQYLSFTDMTYGEVMNLSASHHHPSTYLQRIIQKADHYSSGADRSKSDSIAWKDAEEEEDKNWDSFKRIQMRSVFEGISLTGNNGNANKKLPISEVRLDKSFFPGAENNTTYEALWNKFISEVKFIQSRNFRTFNESLLFLLEKYTIRVPASTQHLPDVSLYDHLKTTAAFSLALYDYTHCNNYGREEKIPGRDEKPFALIGGDLSGIQQFIYNIVARGAAKNLKGRSFYLQLLVDNIVQLVLDELKLFSGNVIYASGGGFYILTANTSELPNTLTNLEKKITETLFEEYGTSLFLAIDIIPFGEAELFYKDGETSTIGSIWEDLSKKLSAKKSRRFQHLLNSRFDEFFSPIPVSPDTLKDAITGDELKKEARKLDPEDNSPNPLMINNSTFQQIELGAKLKSTDYWIQSRVPLTYFNEKSFEPAGLDSHNYFIDKEKLDVHENLLAKSADNVKVIHFNKENFLEPLHKGINNIYGFTWYGGNTYPENNFEEPKTFEELAGVEFDGPNYKKNVKSKSSPSLVRLGILRMDVDNLGAIFRKGLTPQKRSFSRYSTLSRSLDYFFKGYLNTIWKSNQDFSNYTQIIYSGGDDLFIVGKWDVLIRMAETISKDFNEWVCGNEEMTLSGGMAAVGAKFPLLKAAAFSEHFEKSAKNHNYGNAPKNAFSFINYTQYRKQGHEEISLALNWKYEYPYVLHLKEEMKNLISLHGLSEGFTSSLFDLMQQAEFKLDEKEKKYLPGNYRVVWLIAYQFKRSAQGKSEQLQHFYKKWLQLIMTHRIDELPETFYHPLQLLAVAARWASLEERSSLKN